MTCSIHDFRFLVNGATEKVSSTHLRSSSSHSSSSPGIQSLTGREGLELVKLSAGNSLSGPVSGSRVLPLLKYFHDLPTNAS